MSERKSCVGCKFLYGDGSGYSNYTWEETNVTCTKGKNPNLPKEQPYDWNMSEDKDNWGPTQDGRCELYKEGSYIVLDPDRECWPRERAGKLCIDEPIDFDDEEQYEAIVDDDGRCDNDWCPRLTFEEYNAIVKSQRSW